MWIYVFISSGKTLIEIAGLWLPWNCGAQWQKSPAATSLYPPPFAQRACCPPQASHVSEPVIQHSGGTKDHPWLWDVGLFQWMSLTWVLLTSSFLELYKSSRLFLPILSSFPLYFTSVRPASWFEGNPHYLWVPPLHCLQVLPQTNFLHV